MLNLLKKGLVLLGSLFLIQVGAYSLYAKQYLPEVVVQNRLSLAFEKPVYVGFTSQQALSDQQAKDVTLILQRTFPTVNPDRSILDSLPNEMYCSYHFNINQYLPGLATVTYSNVYSSMGEASAYAETFKSSYAWVLFCWWEITNKNTGQS